MPLYRYGGLVGVFAVSGGVEHRQQLLQHRSHRRASLRVVHRLEDPRREAGLDPLQDKHAVHKQLDADVGGRQRALTTSHHLNPAIAVFLAYPPWGNRYKSTISSFERRPPDRHGNYSSITSR